MADEESDEDIFFNKHFQLSTSPQALPDKSTWFQSKLKPINLERFQELKNKLNSVKGLLNNYPLEKWHRHTRNQNPAGFVISAVRKRANPELVTQAWCKFTEILNRFPTLVSTSAHTDESFKTLHLCEAPGAFITALNHFIKLKRISVSWSWMSSSLNPFYEGNSTGAMINDDRFIINTLENWDFGKDDTGDILSVANLEYFVEQYRGQMSLVTADGSIDCQADPARQEILVSGLHFAEIVTALGVLKFGGSLVVKMFTFYESETHQHLYLLKCFFEKIEVVKPATSKEGNSEVYVVCLGFIGIPPEDLDCLIENVLCKKPFVSIFDTIQSDFLDTIEQCAKYFMDIQIDVIERNVRHFEKGFDKHTKTLQKKQVAENFIQRFNLDKIGKTDFIVKDQRKMSAHYNSCRQLDERTEEGTFNDRIINSQKSRPDRVQQLKGQLLKLYPSWLPRCRQVEWVTTNAAGGIALNIIRGCVFDSIQSSKFCPSKALDIYRDSLQDCGILAATNDNNLQKKRKIEAVHAKYHMLKDVLDLPILTELTNIYPEMLSSLVDAYVIKSPYHQNDLLKHCHLQFDAVINQILSVGKEIQRGQHMIILNWPLLTRIQVGLFYIIADHFEEVGFIKPVGNCHGIFFSEFKGEFKHEETLREIQSVNGPDLLAIVSVTELAKEPVYSMIVAHNINVMRETSIHYLQPQ